MKNKLLIVSVILTMISCGSKSEKEIIAKGKEIYIANCISCHGMEGMGIKGIYPSLIKSENISAAQTERAVKLIKYGSGFDAGMKPLPFTDEEIMQVVNYIQNNWGNKAPFLTKDQVKTIKNQ